MIARAHRFHGYGSLNGVYRQGQTARGPQLSLRFAARDPHKPYRVAVVVSRRVHKSAVVRNRIRRRLYEVVRQQSDAIQPGTDLIFTVFADQVATLEASKLKASIADLLKKAVPRG
jgi:ribonuclease P protein component